MNISTKIVETHKGHTVEFTIGVQTFSLKEIENDVYDDTKKHAEWYEKQLNHAFSQLKPKIDPPQFNDWRDVFFDD